MTDQEGNVSMECPDCGYPNGLHTDKCTYLTFRDAPDQEGADQKGSMIDRHIPPKPVNCQECGRFEGHVVTCSAWRPKRSDQRSEQLTGGHSDPYTHPIAAAWTGRGGGIYKPMTSGQENKMAAPNDVLPEINTWLSGFEPFPKGQHFDLLRRIRARIVADGERLAAWEGADKRAASLIDTLCADNQRFEARYKARDSELCQLKAKLQVAEEKAGTVESLAAENRCLRDGVLTDANRRFEERHIADLKKIADLRIKLGVAEERGEMPTSVLAGIFTRLAALESISHKPYDFTALVKRIEAIEERQLPAGATNPPCPKCGSTLKHDWFVCRDRPGDGTTSIKPPPPLSQQELRRKYGLREGTEEQAYIAAAARKECLRDMLDGLRRQLRGTVELVLEKTEHKLLTAALDDYFGDKAGKEITS